MTPAQQASKLGSVGTETVWTLLEISHPDITTLRLVAGLSPVTYAGNTYAPFAFKATPPAKGDGQTMQMQITVSIVDQRVEQALLTLRGQRDVRMKLFGVYSSDGTLAYGPYDMKYNGLVMNDRTQATITCTFLGDFLNQQYPTRNVTPSCAGPST